MWSVLAARAPWYVAGPVIGLLIVGLLWVADTPLGALGGYIELDEWAIRKRSDVGWRDGRRRTDGGRVHVRSRTLRDLVRIARKLDLQATFMMTAIGCMFAIAWMFGA